MQQTHPLETSSEILSENNQTLRKNSNSRSICLQAVLPTSPNICHGSQIQTVLQQIQCTSIGTKFWFCIPTLQLDRSGDKQGSLRKCRGNDISDTHLADTNLVYSPTKNVHTTSSAFASPPKPITKSPGRKHLLVKTTSLRLAA